MSYTIEHSSWAGTINTTEHTLTYPIATDTWLKAKLDGRTICIRNISTIASLKVLVERALNIIIEANAIPASIDSLTDDVARWTRNAHLVQTRTWAENCLTDVHSRQGIVEGVDYHLPADKDTNMEEAHAATEIYSESDDNDYNSLVQSFSDDTSVWNPNLPPTGMDAPQSLHVLTPEPPVPTPSIPNCGLCLRRKMCQCCGGPMRALMFMQTVLYLPR